MKKSFLINALLIISLIVLIIKIYQTIKIKKVEHFYNLENKKVAICICGCIRSFSRKPFRDGLIKLLKDIPNADIFMYLKTHDKEGSTTLVNSENGVNDFMKTIQVIQKNIVKLVFFEALLDSRGNKSTFHAQIRNVNACLNLAEQHKHYDYYLRMRPDYVILDMNLPTTIEDDVIYTNFHYGSPAGDMVYLFSNKLKKEWWDKYVMNLIKTDKWYNHLTPEFILMENMKVKAGPQFYGGLLRTDESKLVMFHGDKQNNLHFNDLASLNISKLSYIDDKYLKIILNKLHLLNIPYVIKKYI